METVTLLRYSRARTRAAILKEIAEADSMDHGTGAVFGGLVCAVEPGQEPLSLRKPGWAWDRHDDQSVMAPLALAAYLHTQGVGRRTMWRLTVRREDVTRYAAREMGYPAAYQFSDGVVLRRGTQAVSIEKVDL